jgi:hypothetical protein
MGIQQKDAQEGTQFWGKELHFVGKFLHAETKIMKREKEGVELEWRWCLSILRFAGY